MAPEQHRAAPHAWLLSWELTSRPRGQPRGLASRLPVLPKRPARQVLANSRLPHVGRLLTAASSPERRSAGLFRLATWQEKGNRLRLASFGEKKPHGQERREGIGLGLAVEGSLVLRAIGLEDPAPPR